MWPTLDATALMCVAFWMGAHYKGVHAAASTRYPNSKYCLLWRRISAYLEIKSSIRNVCISVCVSTIMEPHSTKQYCRSIHCWLRNCTVYYLPKFSITTIIYFIQLRTGTTNTLLPPCIIQLIWYARNSFYHSTRVGDAYNSRFLASERKMPIA